MSFVHDLTHLSFSRGINNHGSFYAAFEAEGDTTIFYKASCYNAKARAIVGHESINEVIVSRLFDILGIEHLSYTPVKADILIEGLPFRTVLCKSSNFIAPDEEELTLDDYYKPRHQKGESALSFCRRIGIGDFLYRMIAADYIIMNRDRYAYNIVLLKNKNTGQIRPAPLFDHGISLLYECWTDEELACFDVMRDKVSGMYIGNWFVTKNLNLIPQTHYPVFRQLCEKDRAALFADLEEDLSPLHQDKLWEMMTKRLADYREYVSSHTLSNSP